jgi:hypothetical protein
MRFLRRIRSRAEPQQPGGAGNEPADARTEGSAPAGVPGPTREPEELSRPSFEMVDRFAEQDSRSWLNPTRAGASTEETPIPIGAETVELSLAAIPLSAGGEAPDLRLLPLRSEVEHSAVLPMSSGPGPKRRPWA